MKTANSVTNSSGSESERSFDLFEIMIVLAKRKKILVLVPVIAAIISGALTMALPNVYQATTKVLPPQQSQGGATALLAQLGGVAGLAAGAAGMKSSTDLYVGMLKSRTVADKLIARYDLKKSYDVESQEKARKILEKNTNIVAGKDGLITIDVEDENKDGVANIANSYVTELLSLSKSLALTEASQRRLFFERQLEISKDNLAAAESRLKKAMDAHGVISVEGESRAMVETMGRVRAMVSAKEIQLGAMRAVVTGSNPEYLRAQGELSSLRLELSKLENGRAKVGEETGNETGKPAGLDNIKILRDVKYHEMLFELLAKQFEVARLDESKEPSIVQVLDPAVTPEKQVKPKRIIIVFVSAMLAFLFSLIFVFVVEIKNRMLQDSESAGKLAELHNNLKFQ